MIAAAGTDDAAERRTQLLRGVLDMCLLALLTEAPAHGYEVVRRLEAAGFGGVGYGTVYPLLTRMRRLGLVADEVQESPTGPPRKVHRVTGDGRAALDVWARQWGDFARLIDTALAGATTPNREGDDGPAGR